MFRGSYECGPTAPVSICGVDFRKVVRTTDTLVLVSYEYVCDRVVSCDSIDYQL